MHFERVSGSYHLLGLYSVLELFVVVLVVWPVHACVHALYFSHGQVCELPLLPQVM